MWICKHFNLQKWQWKATHYYLYVLSWVYITCHPPSECCYKSICYRPVIMIADAFGTSVMTRVANQTAVIVFEPIIFGVALYKFPCFTIFQLVGRIGQPLTCQFFSFYHEKLLVVNFKSAVLKYKVAII